MTATPGNAQVALTWAASTGSPTQYYVLRSTTTGGSYTQIATVTAPAVTYTDTTAANNASYFYVVQASNGSGTSANSSEVAATPGGASGLLGWWKFDENTGTTANDSSGFANTGTFTSAGWATGRSGYAGSFNGTSSVVDTGKSLVANTNSFTVACWVKLPSSGSYKETFVSQDGSNQSNFYLQYISNTNNFGFQMWNADVTDPYGPVATSTTTLTYGTWYHLIGAYDAVNSQINLYVNGNLEGTQSFTSSWNATGHTIIGRGKYNGAASDPVNGSIDGVRVYNRLLTAAEIATISAYPTGVTTAQASATSATISWSAFPNATSYNLYRSTTAGTEGGTPIATGLTGTSYTNTGLTPGTTYYYKLSATTASGESAQSDEVSLTPLAVPTSLAATTSAATPAILTWSAATGATSYNVLRGTSSGGETSLATGITGTSYNDTTATRGTTYFYVVQAVSGGNTSANSSEVSVDPVNTSSPYYQINAGGGAVSPFAADAWHTGGTALSDSRSVDVTAVNAAPTAVYQSRQSTGTITYTFPGLTPSAAYVVRLHENDWFNSTTGQRQFNVAINGTTVLTNFDVIGAAGAPQKAVVRNFNAIADSGGNITVVFSPGAAGNPMVEGLEILGGSVTAAPTSLAATPASATSVTLTWGSVTGATSYNLYRSTSAGTEGSTPYQTGLTGTSYTDTGQTSGTTYYYKLVAVNAQGESALSNEASITPFAPTGVAATTSAATPAILTWSAATGATSYNVLRGTSSGGETSLATGITGTSYNDTTATRGTTYFYVVQASNSSGTSASSSEVSVDPVNTSSPYYQINAAGPAAAPFAADVYCSGGLQAGSAAAINVTAPNSAPQAVYQTERNSVGGTPAGGPITFTLPGLTASGTYVVRLHFSDGYWGSAGQRKFNVSINSTSVLTNFDVWAAANAGKKSVVRNFNTTADAGGNIAITLSNGSADQLEINGIEVLSGTVTAAPTLAVSAASATSASLTWGSVTGATSYNLYRSASAGTEGSTPIATGLTGTSYTNTGLTTGAAYYYKLTAVNAQGESALSSEVSLTPLAAPTGVVATPGNAQVALTWTATTGATSYNVLRGTSPGTETSLATGITGTSYTDSTAANNTTYYYVVQAVNSSGTSAGSSEVSATPGGASGLLGWWKFDENTGTTVNDSSGFSNTGTFTGAGWATGRSGYAGTFNGTSSAVDTGKGVIATANSFTVACWVKLNTVSGNNQTFVSQDGTYLSNFYLQYSNSGHFVLFCPASDMATLSGGYSYAASTTTVMAGVWYHIIGVYDAPNSQVKIYVNGALQDTQPFTTPWSAVGHTVIGRGKYNGNSVDWTNGSIDGVRVYNRLLTAAEIATISAYPTGVTAAQASATSATISWAAFPNATSYNLYRSTTAGGEGGTPIATGLTGTSYTNTGLTTGTTYYYKLSATTASGESAQSDEVSLTPLAAPTGLAVAQASATSSTLTWTAVTGATSYNLYRSTSAGTEGSTPYQTGLTGTSYTNTGLTSGTTYYYKLTAANAQGESAQSSEVSLTPLAAPTGVVATPGNAQVALTWTATTGATSYNVLRGTSPGTETSLATGITSTSYTDSTAANNTTYFYVVQAVNAGATSAGSSEVSATPAVPTLLLVKRITAVNGVPVSGFVSDGAGKDTNAYWPSPSSTYLRGGLTATAKPGDTVEYTIYFLVVGSGSVTSVVVSNILPAHVNFAATAYNSLTPTDGGSGSSGLALALSAAAYPSAPTVYLSNAADGDRGTYYASGMAVPGICTALQNTNGVIAVNVVTSPTTLPAATSASSPYNSYGFVRYRVTIQ